MHPFFQPLSERETMLLLTTLTVGGAEELPIFEHLPTESKTRLQAKASALKAIPSEQRVTFMVREMKQAFSFKGLRGIERVDPSWILQALKGESPRVVATVLISLPAPSVRAIVKRLPEKIRKKLPPKGEIKQIPVELMSAVRQIFESRFHVMPPVSSGQSFCFRDIIHLERNDIYRLMRALGLVELGQAFAVVGKMALAELCRRLPRSKAEELILAVRSASRMDAPNLKTAQQFLSRVVVNFTETEEFFQKAGLWRLAKSAMLEDQGFRESFRQRLPREAGQLFHQYVEKASEMGEELSEEPLKRHQDSALATVCQLAERAVIDGRWKGVRFNYHFPQDGQPGSDSDSEQGAA